MLKTERYLANSKGFTLIEMLAVLFIVFSLSAIIMNFSFKHLHYFAEDQLLFELQLKFREAQLIAHHNQREVFFSTLNNDLIIYDIEKTYFRQTFPPNLEVSITHNFSNKRLIEIDSTMGNLVGGKITVKSERKKQEARIQLGKGRFFYDSK